MIGCNHLSVDVGFDRDHICAVALDCELIDGVGPLNRGLAIALDVHHRALLDAQAAFADILKNLSNAVTTRTRQETHMAEIDAEHGNRAPRQTANTVQKCSVTADTDHYRLFGLITNAFAIQTRSIDATHAHTFKFASKLFIYTPIEAANLHCINQLTQQDRAQCRICTRKKYDLHY